MDENWHYTLMSNRTTLVASIVLGTWIKITEAVLNGRMIEARRNIHVSFAISIFPPRFFHPWEIPSFPFRQSLHIGTLLHIFCDTEGEGFACMINTLPSRANQLMRIRAISNWLITRLTNGTHGIRRIIHSQCLIVRCKWAASSSLDIFFTDTSLRGKT